MSRSAPPTRTLRELFARNVRLMRVNGGLSQERMADLAQLDRTFIGSLERGERNISIDNIERLATVLGLPAHELMSPEFAERHQLDETVTRAPRSARVYPAERRQRTKPGA